ncbi:MAG: hypothetical protein LBC27_08110 [Spirochaetaceae bacterium]|nr:hypothetical protein [Spirochaetaceae bacterium]
MITGLYRYLSDFSVELTYIARINPSLPCTIPFDDEEWKVLYCMANRTKKAPEKPYSIAEAVEHIGNFGGPGRSPKRRYARCKNCLAGFYRNSIPSTTIGKCSILWVKFSASGEVLDPTANKIIR